MRICKVFVMTFWRHLFNNGEPTSHRTMERKKRSWIFHFTHNATIHTSLPVGWHYFLLLPWLQLTKNLIGWNIGGHCCWQVLLKSIIIFMAVRWNSVKKIVTCIKSYVEQSNISPEGPCKILMFETTFHLHLLTRNPKEWWRWNSWLMVTVSVYVSLCVVFF